MPRADNSQQVIAMFGRLLNAGESDTKQWILFMKRIDARVKLVNRLRVGELDDQTDKSWRPRVDQILLHGIAIDGAISDHRIKPSFAMLVEELIHVIPVPHLHFPVLYYEVLSGCSALHVVVP